ncbi:MAG: DUF1178 family protein [Rhodobacteraceae bacterium]|nr:DUF1178 family protein [Paracoccaceae bacterium]
MIRYSLKCVNDHTFDSWFQSAKAFEKLSGCKLISCTECGSTDVAKAIMAPWVAPLRKTNTAAPLSVPASEIEQKLAAMRQHVEENSDYVGMSFAAEARAIHDGDQPKRSIYGEAHPDEARALIEEGVPVAPLPFMPTRKTN